MTTLCRRFWISGRVQGVCYRAATRAYATRKGLIGWVRNMSDGRVEAVACGDMQQLEDFEHWLHLGPELAKVDSVVATEVDYVQFDGFQIR